MDIAQFMSEKGFAAGSSGSGCEWYTKDFMYQGKQVFLAITDNGGMDLPTSLDEPVIVGVYDLETEDVIEQPKLFDSVKAALDAFDL